MSIRRIGESRTFSEISDVYSFGVFLLELITGQEAFYDDSFRSDESLFEWVCNNDFYSVFSSNQFHIISGFSIKKDNLSVFDARSSNIRC